MANFYIDVSDFIVDPSTLIKSGSYYYDNSRYCIVSIPNVTPLRIDFKLVVREGKYYIPLHEYVTTEPTTLSYEVYINNTDTKVSGTTDYMFNLVRPYTQDNGVVDYSKVEVKPIDEDNDGVYDQPLSFEEIIPEGSIFIMETYVDTDKNILTRVGENVVFLSKVSYITENTVYYADITKSIIGQDGKSLRYSKGSFYKGDNSSGTSTPNTATLLKSGLDTENNVRYYVKNGRSYTTDTPFIFKWQHYISDDADRVDPSISNVMDMYVLTTEYNNSVRSWLNNRGSISDFPVVSTSETLRNNLKFIEKNKSTSDQVVYIPAKFKLLFGDTAPEQYRAKFKIIKSPSTSLTDNEIKSNIIDSINAYFEIENWDFGEIFYFSELSAYIHKQLVGDITSIIIVPEFENSSFGDLYEIRCDSNELFLSTATVANIDITTSYNSFNMRRN